MYIDCPCSTSAALDSMLRSLVIGQLGHYGDEDTIKEAQKRFADHCAGSSSIPADLKAAVFSTCLANGDGSTFDQLLKVSQLVSHNIILSTPTSLVASRCY